MARAVFALVFLLATPAVATTVLRASFDELTRVSSVVLHGVVRAVDDELATTPLGPFRTAVEIEVLDSLKGSEAGAILRLELPGGRAGERVMRIPGMPRFVSGDEIVIFLEALPRGGFAVTGLGQGVFRVRPDGSLERDLRGLGIVDTRGAHVHHLPAMPTTLAQLKLSVRGVTP